MVIHKGAIEHSIDILKLSVTVFDCVDTFLGVDSVNALRRCTLNALRLSRHVSQRSNNHYEIPFLMSSKHHYLHEYHLQIKCVNGGTGDVLRP